MPLLRVTTNKPVSNAERQEIAGLLSSSVSAILNKPEDYVMVILQTDATMQFAGSTEPLAYLELKSLGLPEDKTADFSSALCSLVRDHLGITPDRTYIEFSSPPRHFWGWNETTF